MTKIIFVEGPRNVGKTYLTQRSSFQQWYHKLDFSFYHNLLDFKAEVFYQDEKAAGVLSLAFSFGKDLQLLQLLKNDRIRMPLIVDRSFLSSIVYARFFERCSDTYLAKYTNHIRELLYQVEGQWHVLRVEGVNPHLREAKDIFSKDENYTKESYLFDQYTKFVVKDTDFTIFENQFDDLSVIRFNKLLGELVTR